MGQYRSKPTVAAKEVGNDLNHATTQIEPPVQATPSAQEPKVHRRKPSKADSNHPRELLVFLLNLEHSTPLPIPSLRPFPSTICTASTNRN